MLTGRTRQNKLVHFRRRRPLRAGTLRRRSRSPTAAPHHLARAARRGHRPSPPPHPHPGRRRLNGAPAAGRSSSARRRRASRRVAMAVARAAAGHRDRRRRLDAGVPGHGHRHGQADAGRAGRGAAPLPRPRRPGRGLHRRRVHRRGRRRALADDRTPRPRRAVLVGGTGLYLRAVVDRLEPPGRVAGRSAAELEAEPDDAPAAARRARRRSTRSRPPRWSRPTARRVVRALEVTLGSGRPFSSFGPGSTPTRRSPSSRSGCGGRAPCSATRIERAGRTR